jgi:hypothetical protein
MAGRKRKAGKRRPCGRLVQQELENRGGPVAARRALDHLLKAASDPAMGTVFGRMFLRHEISSSSFVAASRFASLRARADHALGLPARNPRALAFESTKGLSLNPENPEYTQEILKSFYEAEAVIGRGTVALAAIENVVIHDQELVGYERKLAFKWGLERLASYWRLT